MRFSYRFVFIKNRKCGGPWAGFGCPPNHRGFGFNGVWTVYLIVCERNWDAMNDHATLMYGRECERFTLLSLLGSLSEPEVTGGVKETEAPPQLLGGT